MRRFFGVSCGVAITLIVIHTGFLAARHQWSAAGSGVAAVLLVIGFGVALDAAMAILADLDARIGVSFDMPPGDVAEFGKVVQERVKFLRDLGDDFTDQEPDSCDG